MVWPLRPRMHPRLATLATRALGSIGLNDGPALRWNGYSNVQVNPSG